jgi:hypothetical protein
VDYRRATPADAGRLAALNWQLIRDEGHRNLMSVSQLEGRMTGWLAGEYEAFLFEDSGETLGYVLFRRDPEFVYVRQFFIRAGSRRLGVGRGAVEWLVELLAGVGLPGLLPHAGTRAVIRSSGPRCFPHPGS